MGIRILDIPPPLPGRRFVYGPGPSRFAELRLPDGPGPFPAVVAIHGGYWRSRYDLGYFGHVCERLTSLGIATWNIEYRRAGEPGGGYPGTFHDVVAAVSKLISLAPELRIDPRRISVVGHSAGGHLACWLAGAGRVDRSSEIAARPIPLRSVVSIAGVYDVRHVAELNLSNGAAIEFLGVTPESDPARFAAASPITLMPHGVRQLIIHGTEDEPVPFAMAEAYAARAKELGEPVTFLPLPGVDHFDVVDPESAVWAQIEPAILEHVL